MIKDDLKSNFIVPSRRVALCLALVAFLFVIPNSSYADGGNVLVFNPEFFLKSSLKK